MAAVNQLTQADCCLIGFSRPTYLLNLAAIGDFIVTEVVLVRRLPWRVSPGSESLCSLSIFLFVAAIGRPMMGRAWGGGGGGRAGLKRAV